MDGPDRTGKGKGGPAPGRARQGWGSAGGAFSPPAL